MNYSLEVNEEICFSSSNSQGNVSIQVLEGICYMKGFRIPPMKKISIRGSFFLYCIEKPCRIQYIANGKYQVKKQQTNGYYTNLYSFFSKHFDENEDNEKEEGFERILIIGDTDTGKSTLCDVLCQEMLKNGKKKDKVIFSDFDVGQNEFLPGMITYSTIYKNENVEDYFHEKKETRERKCFFYGMNHPSNGDLYKHFGNEIHQLLEKESPSDTKGCVINTCGWVRGKGFGLICQLLYALHINTCIVIDNDSVFQRIQHQFYEVNTFHFQKNPNVQKRSRNYRKSSRITQIRNYFLVDHHSFKITLPMNQIEIYKFGMKNRGGVGSSSSMMKAIGNFNTFGNLRIMKLDLSSSSSSSSSLIQKHSILGVSSFTNDQVNTLLTSPIFGIVYILNIQNNNNKSITFLSPSKSFPPNVKFILSDLNYE